MASVAVYTTVYPGVERFLEAWLSSVVGQADQDFELWIGLDALSVDAARAAMGGDPDAIWVLGHDRDTPGSLRQRALAQIVERHSAVVLVDSDDVMHATRVATAREMLRRDDMVACALRLVDEHGSSLDATFGLPPGVTTDAVFPHTNVFGLSNTAFRSSMLKRCLPIPAEAELVDWYLSTRAWLLGASMAFAADPEMDYRQHGANMARVRGPYGPQQVIEDTERVRAHYRLVLAGPPDGAMPDRVRLLKAAADDVEVFHDRVVARPDRLERYLDRLNEHRSDGNVVVLGGRTVVEAPVEEREGDCMKTIALGEATVGEGHPPYVIAEIGSNHNGDMDLCRKLIDAASEAGAQAVKFQSWSESSLIAREEYERNPDYADKKKHFGSLREMVRAYQLTPDQHVVAQSYCREKGVEFCSSVFSPEEADLLESLDVPYFKLASMDIANLPLLSYVAAKGRPMLLATGMATLGEIEAAVDTVRAEGNRDIVLLHCVSIYPPDFDSIRLLNIPMLRAAFGVPTGFSDHTLGTAIPLAAVAVGACVIEKHFTLDKDMEGWDHAISADPPELRVIVEEGRHVFESLGGPQRIVTEAEMEKRERFRRSLVVRRELGRGHVLVERDLTAKRPGSGIAPAELGYVLGRRLAGDVEEDHVLRWEDLQ